MCIPVVVLIRCISVENVEAMQRFIAALMSAMTASADRLLHLHEQNRAMLDAQFATQVVLGMGRGSPEIPLLYKLRRGMIQVAHCCGFEREGRREGESEMYSHVDARAAVKGRAIARNCRDCVCGRWGFQESLRGCAAVALRRCSVGDVWCQQEICACRRVTNEPESDARKIHTGAD